MAACVYYKNNKNIKWQSCLSDEILTAIKERDRLKEELEKGQIQRMSFNAARNKVVRLIKKAKKEAVINKKDNSKLNSRVLWKTLKSIFPIKAKQMSRINSLNKDGTSYSTPEEIANVFNEHFISIADNIIDNTISSFSGRYQKVWVDGKLSEPLGIHSGVLQGSILEPALFLLFINDLPLVMKNNIGIYADDSTLYPSAPTLAEVEEKIRPEIDAVSMLAKENKMKMQPAKTKYSIISSRQKIANSVKQSLDLSVDGMQLTKVESERVLGVYIDSHLTWNEHSETLRQKLHQRIALLARARKYIPTKYRLLLYYA